MVRDGHGQALATVLDEVKPDGGNGFTIKLKEPFSLLLDGLGKVSSLPLFVMPERLADTDPFQQISEVVGSGPFKFVNEEFEPGHRVVYVRNIEYVPRQEPPSWASGGKVAKIDRVEWLIIPDAATKAAALNNGEADWWENPPLELVPILAANPI
jgi:peptide/nickel transport system substrate-binding protein